MTPTTPNKDPRTMTAAELTAAGLAHPKCYGCGHNYFDCTPRPLVDGKPASGGLCHWCIADKAYERD